MNGKKIIGNIAKMGAVMGAIGGIFYLDQKELKKTKEKFEKQSAYYALAQKWLQLKSEGKDFKEYFSTNQIKSVAIYGMGTLGELFYDEVKNSGVKVEYFVDKNAEEIYYGMDDIAVIGLDDLSAQAEVDAIIVTPIYNFDDISEDLEDSGISANVISLEDVVYEV